MATLKFTLSQALSRIRRTRLRFTLSLALSRALSAYNAGKLVEAEQLCQQIIDAKPDCLMRSLFLLSRNQNLAKKKRPWRATIARSKYGRDYAEVLSNRGVTLHELKRFEEAVASYDRALTLRPDYVEALNNRGNALKALMRFEEALTSSIAPFAVRPNSAEALSNRGLTLHELKQFEEALASYDRALTLRPDFAEALSNRGKALKELRRFEEALASYAAPLKCSRIMPMCITMRHCAGYSLATLIAAGKNTNGDGKLGN